MIERPTLAIAVSNNPAVRIEEVEAFRAIQLRHGRQAGYSLVPPLAGRLIIRQQGRPGPILTWSVRGAALVGGPKPIEATEV